MSDNQTRLDTLRAIANGTEPQPASNNKPKRSLFISLMMMAFFLSLGYFGASYFKATALPLLSMSNVPTETVEQSQLVIKDQMVKINSGQFIMGNALGPLDCQTERLITLDAYWMDLHEVTNAQFAKFINETGYQTTAQRAGFSWVLDSETYKVKKTAGASWEQPIGPGSTIIGKEELPVVHVSWTDARAYAQWAGKRLPTEAEWEYAARGLLNDCNYPWGREVQIKNQAMANTGRLHVIDTDADGFTDLAPVAKFPPNQLGLYDMIGNVAEWCSDYYQLDGYEATSLSNPKGPVQGTQRVIRGGDWGSYINDPESKIATWSRQHSSPGDSSNLIGFRCAKNATLSD